MTTVSEFTVREGQTVPFVLTHQASHLPPAAPIDPAAALAETEAFWRDWLAKCMLDGHMPRRSRAR